MIKGLTFRIPQGQDNILLKILHCIDVRKYSWYSIQSQREAWFCEATSSRETFMDETYYTGTRFLRCISEPHFIVFLKLEAYLGKTQYVDIHTYKEFQESECKILILIYDCKYVEIFLKEPKELEKLYDNAWNKGFEDVEYITERNDARTQMDVL